MIGVSLPPPLQELSAAKHALAAAMLDARHRASGLERRAREGEIPLSFAQERLYFLDRMQPGSPAYNVYAGLRLRGRLHVTALERALGEVVRRHEALRTTFREADGVPVQVVEPFTGFLLPVEDLSPLASAEREEAVKRRAAEDAGRLFDLATGPLFRATLLRLGPGEHQLLLALHHIVTDGWSMEVLYRELCALYAAYAGGCESPLPEPALQYADFALWQRERLRGERVAGELAWWKERLAGAPERLELPTDRPRPAVPTYRGRMVRAMLPACVLERLEALGRGEGATLFMVLLGAFQALLSKYGGTDDVVVGTPVSGRTHRETEGLIGCFVNTMVLRTDLGGDPTFREVVRRVRAVALGACDHQEVPFERVVAELHPQRTPGHSPLFQVMFTLAESTDEAWSPFPGLAVRRTEGERQTSKFELTLACSRRSAGLAAALEYATDLFDAETVERMLAHFVRLVRQVAEDPARRLSGVELLAGAERDRALDEWNGAERPYPLDRCIHRLIEAQAGRTPAAV
ncbi:MAG TPA: condensation domain-containing protein, partial [Longimicrobiaceae bacterium]|nr:condensation domain-containing protein [Longimicrobiaceae bacterium]